METIELQLHAKEKSEMISIRSNPAAVAKFGDSVVPTDSHEPPVERTQSLRVLMGTAGRLHLNQPDRLTVAASFICSHDVVFVMSDVCKHRQYVVIAKTQRCFR